MYLRVLSEGALFDEYTVGVRIQRYRIGLRSGGRHIDGPSFHLHAVLPKNSVRHSILVESGGMDILVDGYEKTSTKGGFVFCKPTTAGAVLTSSRLRSQSSIGDLLIVPVNVAVGYCVDAQGASIGSQISPKRAVLEFEFDPTAFCKDAPSLSLCAKEPVFEEVGAGFVLQNATVVHSEAGQADLGGCEVPHLDGPSLCDDPVLPERGVVYFNIDVSPHVHGTSFVR